MLPPLLKLGETEARRRKVRSVMQLSDQPPPQTSPPA